MHSQLVGLRVAGAIFALFCLGQLARVALQPEVMVAGYRVPLWPSAIAAAVFAALCAWMWSLARISGSPPAK
jgi:hypothetical protein